MFEPFTSLIVPSIIPTFIEGTTAFLRGELRDGSNALVESGQVQVTVTWEGLPVLLSRQLQFGIVAALTSADFTAIKNAVLHAYSNAP
jgi:hypothetical protein